jgi:cytochrome c-type biogenesis protein CcmH
MVTFLLFGLVTVAVLAILLVPLLRAPRNATARAAYDLEVYRDQLRELETDARCGLIGAEARDAARREIERRILALDLGPQAWADGGTSMVRRFAAAGAILMGVPLIAGAIYLALGAPGLPDQPLAARDGEVAVAGAEAGDIDAMVGSLAERLKSEPDNLEGWTLLARSYGALGRYDEAVEALRRVVELTNGSLDAVAMLAEHMVFAADGAVTPDALALFDQVASAQPGNPAAAFYRGLARDQAGDGAGALAIWTALGQTTPAEAPWLANLRDQIAAAAEAIGADPATYLAGIPEPAPAPAVADSGAAGATEAPGPTAEDMAAAADMSAEDQQTMIRGMVERLAERLEQEPGDLEGWLRLGNAYRVLGEAAKSRDAYAQAATLSPDDPAVLVPYAEAIGQAAPDGAGVPAAAVLVWRRVLELDTANPSALWALGHAAAADGQAAEARRLWTMLRDLLPAGSAERDRVEQELDRLPAG